MEVSSHENESPAEFVLMPWDDRTNIFMTGEENEANVCSRWEQIQKQLNIRTNISSVDDLINIINSYNVVLDKNRQQSKLHWKCLVLRQYFNQLDEFERKQFFLENGTLSTIRNLALQLKELLPRLKILKSGSVCSIKLHQLQIASLLANAFLCTFPKGKADCPSINFNTLYEGGFGSILKYNVEKIKCIVHYFKRIHDKQPTGNLSFHRLSIPDNKFPRWDKTNADFCSLKVDIQGKIEDQEGFLQMDFANRYIGGGVLGRGCVQEEIRFVICPELIAARLFTESLADNESLLIVGAERYCQYSGYSDSFTFVGDYQDNTPFDENRHRKTYLIALDALYFHHSSEQYRESKILRELKKAFVGFKQMEENYMLPLATGNWGCGAFGGDPQLKSILQLMASSQAQRDMLYLTFGNSVLKNQIEELYQLLKKKSVNVGMLYRIIRLYNREKRKNQTLFEFISASLNRPEKRKLSPKPTGSGQLLSSAFESSLLSTEGEASKSKYRIEKREAKEAPEGNFPELNLDFNALDNLVQNTIAGQVTSSKNQNLSAGMKSKGNQFPLPPKEGSSDFSRAVPSILDMMWVKDSTPTSSTQGNSRESAKLERDEKNSPSLFSEDEDMETTSERGEGCLLQYEDMDITEMEVKPQNLRTECENFTVQRKTDSPQAKKFVQPKITDCFFKK